MLIKFLETLGGMLIDRCQRGEHLGMRKRVARRLHVGGALVPIKPNHSQRGDRDELLGQKVTKFIAALSADRDRLSYRRVRLFNVVRLYWRGVVIFDLFNNRAAR
jgi:hypothetical protein